MSTNRRKFTDEFKVDAVQLVVQGQRPIAQVARELEINESSLGYWVKTYRQQHPDPETAPAPVDAARIARLEEVNIGEKPWTLLGEATSRSRPAGSLLAPQHQTH